MRLLVLAVRSHRTGMVAVGLITALFGALSTVGFDQIAGATPAERAIFARQMELIGKQLAYILPEPIRVDTLAGFIAWRAIGALLLYYAVWAVLAASGAARGDEERGLTEHWLATGISRTRYLATRAAGFVIAATIAIAVGLGGTLLSAIAVGEEISPTGTLWECVLLVGLMLACFGVALFIAQFAVTRRAAGSLAAIVTVALFVLNSAHRTGVDTRGLEVVSPFYHFDRSTPLLEPYSLDAGATAVMYLVGVALVAAGVVLFLRRDVAGPVVRLGGEPTRRVTRPSRDPFLRLPLLALLDQGRGWIVGWAIGLCALAYFMTSMIRVLVDSLMAIPSFRIVFERFGIQAYSDFVGSMWFSIALLILSALVVTQVSGWASDDAEGRLEAVLGSGASRTRVVLERIAAVLVGCAIIAAASSLVVYAVASALDIVVPEDRLALATALTVPVVFAFAAVGHALVGWRPRGAVVILGTLAVLSYLTQQFAPLLDWPEWVRRTSFYALYGKPMTEDDRSGIGILVVVGVVGTAAAVLSMRRRDVGT